MDCRKQQCEELRNFRDQLQQTQESIAGTRNEATRLMEEVNELKEKIIQGQEQFIHCGNRL